MKNLFYKGFKKNKLTSRVMVGIFLLFTLFLSGCFYFNFVNQPYQADPNSYFDVQISAYVEGDGWGSAGLPRFGVLLPIGWVPQDSISYFIDNWYLYGTLIYSDSLSQSMSAIDPPPENYYWWVAHDTIGIVGDEVETCDFDLRIYTDAQTGTFFLDYMLGSSGQGLNYSRSNEHLIIVGEPQGCAPEGIVLSTQAEVDSFQYNYPVCSQIAGNFSISGNDITNLNGLNGITQIGGSLRVENNATLTSLIGLNDLTAIGGSFYIAGNSLLEDFSGLNNLTTIERHFWVDTNQLLTDFSGLENLVSVGRNFHILNNNTLTSLAGLKNFESFSRDLQITGNASLTSLTGLEGITSIGGNLTITDNSLLSNCEVEVICAYLSIPNGTVKISNNSPGCNSMLEVAGACNLTFPCQQNYTFTSQIDINYFPLVYPNCNEIEGNVTIMGSSITNLDGLSMVSSIGGGLSIRSNSSLTSLTGLEGVTSIGVGLEIRDNAVLISLTGLESLASIGGYLKIGDYYSGNPALTSLTGLENLTFIGGELWIGYNDTLTGLSGLSGLTSIGGDISIRSNSALTSLAGLENMTSIGGDLSIRSNSALTSLAGLEEVTSIGGGLGISNNAVLTSLTGLDNLASIGGDLNIGYDGWESGNPSLISLMGLENLSSIGGGLSIRSNNALTSLSGLVNLTSIGGYLQIGDYSAYGNPALTSLTGLESLNSIGSYLLIGSNIALTSLTGLDNIAANSITNLLIRNNSSLSTCETIGIEEVVAGSDFSIFPNPFTGRLSIEFNLPQTSLVSIQIFNAMGANVAELHHGQLPAGQQQIVWDSGNLPKGMYFCRMQIGDELIAKKIIKVQ